MESDLNPRGAPGRIEQELAALRERSLHRTLEPAGAVPLVELSSNDYLGLAGHPDLALAVIAAIRAGARVAATGSRLLSGHAQVWDEVEDDFARFVGSEAALFFSSGYAANLGLLPSILRREDLVFSDAANHASIIDGIRLAQCRKVIFPHRDAGFLENALQQTPVNGGERFIVTESIFSMDGDRAPLADLLALAERHGASMIVDEAHATGVAGDHGGGMVSAAMRASGAVLATVHPCGKALAAAGAFVAGSHALRELLINRARTFIFNTALPPYMAAQVAAALRLVAGADGRREQLAETAAFARRRLRAAGFDLGPGDTQIAPVFIGAAAKAQRAAAAVRAGGFAVRAIRPPTVPEGTSRLRLSLTTNVSLEDVERLAHVLVRHREEAR